MKAELGGQVILELTMDDARWLRALVQNPILPPECLPEDEDAYNREKRLDLFHALNAVPGLGSAYPA
jgi:hypothetical protein